MSYGLRRRSRQGAELSVVRSPSPERRGGQGLRTAPDQLAPVVRHPHDARIFALIVNLPVAYVFAGRPAAGAFIRSLYVSAWQPLYLHLWFLGHLLL